MSSLQQLTFVLALNLSSAFRPSYFVDHEYMLLSSMLHDSTVVIHDVNLT